MAAQAVTITQRLGTSRLCGQQSLRMMALEVHSVLRFRLAALRWHTAPVAHRPVDLGA